MSPSRRSAAAALALILSLPVAAVSAGVEPEPLRVCSDRQNMPFSDDRLEGFENKIAGLIGAELGRPLDYVWAPQYRGFLRKTLLSGDCDLVAGLSGAFPRVSLTRPYYVSSYVFVSPRKAPPPEGFDDPRLKRARIGLHVLGMEGANAPPAAALARRSLAANVVGFPVWGERGAQGRIVDAVADGEIDVAAAWGPAVGFFAGSRGHDLVLTPILSDPSSPETPFAFAVSMAVRQADAGLLAEVQGALDRRREEIDAVLSDFGVPRLDIPSTSRVAGRAAARVSDSPPDATDDPERRKP